MPVRTVVMAIPLYRRLYRGLLQGLGSGYTRSLNYSSSVCEDAAVRREILALAEPDFGDVEA